MPESEFASYWQYRGQVYSKTKQLSASPDYAGLNFQRKVCQWAQEGVGERGNTEPGNDIKYMRSAKYALIDQINVQRISDLPIGILLVRTSSQANRTLWYLQTGKSKIRPKLLVALKFNNFSINSGEMKGMSLPTMQEHPTRNIHTLIS